MMEKIEEITDDEKKAFDSGHNAGRLEEAFNAGKEAGKKWYLWKVRNKIP